MAEEGVSPMEFWVVLTPGENARVHEDHAISPSTFEHATSPTFWWLFRTRDYALQFTIRKCTRLATLAATQVTTWFAVKLTLSQAQWTQMTTTCDPSEPSIVRPAKGKMWWMGFQVAGTLPIDNNITISLGRMTITPTGTDLFAESRLPKHRKREGMQCDECSEGTFVWLASWQDDPSASQRKAYCSACWHAWIEMAEETTEQWEP